MDTDHPAVAWAADLLSDLGRPLSGDPAVAKDRSWSLVVRMPTAAGDAWLKVNRGGTTYEPAVLELLARIAPDSVLHPLAVDLARGWSLTPDGGPTLREARGESPPDPAVVGDVLKSYAEVQRSSADHAAELVTVGVPDLRPGRLPAVLDDLVDGADWDLLAGGDEPDPTARARVLAHRSVLAERCAELAERSEACGIPATLQHDDLHDNNVFVGDGRHGAGYRIFDWGDACVSHPFQSLLVALRSFAAWHEVDVDDPVVRAVRRAYLDGWTDLAPVEELERVADLAVAVAPVGRAHSWRNALVDASAGELDDFADAVPGWLAELVPLTHEHPNHPS